MGFFTALAEILQNNQRLTIEMESAKDGEISVVVLPKPPQGTDPDKFSKALQSPFYLTAAPEELDEGFLSAFNQFKRTRAPLMEQASAVVGDLQKAVAKEQKELKKTEEKAGVTVTDRRSSTSDEPPPEHAEPKLELVGPADDESTAGPIVDVEPVSAEPSAPSPADEDDDTSSILGLTDDEEEEEEVQIAV